MDVLARCIGLTILMFFLLFLMVHQLLQPQVNDTNTWVAAAYVPGSLPAIGSGPTGSYIPTAFFSSGVYVVTPNISLSTLDIIVTFVYFDGADDVSGTFALSAALTTPESNGEIVWVVQLEMSFQTLGIYPISASATGGVLYAYGNTGKVVPFEQYDASGKNELSVDGAYYTLFSDELPSYCVNTTLERDCRVSATLGWIGEDYKLQARFEHALLPTSSPTQSPTPVPTTSSPPTPSPSS